MSGYERPKPTAEDHSAQDVPRRENGRIGLEWHGRCSKHFQGSC
jgi:hypothetical protein